MQFAVVEVFDIELCKEYFAEGKVTDYNICTVSGAGIPENLRIGVCNGDKGKKILFLKSIEFPKNGMYSNKFVTCKRWSVSQGEGR